MSGSRSRRELGISGGRRAFHALGMIKDVSLRLPCLVIDRLLSWLTLLDHAPSFKDSSLSSAVRGEASLARGFHRGLPGGRVKQLKGATDQRE